MRRPGTFKLEYAYYILAVLFIALLCLCSIRLAIHNGRKSPATGPRPARGAVNGNAYPGRLILAPWGWPNHASTRGVGESGLGDRLRRMVVRLTSKRQLIGSPSSDLRRNRCIRALLEDRYGRLSSEAMPAIEYHKVKPPRLRDPRAPHDQMDNFGTGEAARIPAQLERHGVKGRVRTVSVFRGRKVHDLELKDIKQPWGW